MIKLFLAEMPLTVEGVAVKMKQNESNYMILINKDISMQKQVNAFRHELLHIINDDFESNLPLETVERINRERMRKLYNE